MPRRHAIITHLLVLAAAPALAGVTPEEVRHSVDSGVKWLLQRQQATGTWPSNQHEGGETALATLALLSAGMTAADEPISRALQYLENLQTSDTYVIALKIAVFARADAGRLREQIQKHVGRLVNGQLENGMWTYEVDGMIHDQNIGDNSNTQFALLGLHEGALVGALIPKRTWLRARRHWQTTQIRDGGWSYQPAIRSPSGSMTAAGVASLVICGGQLNEADEKGYAGGAAPNCGRYRQDPAMTSGLTWLARNFDVRRNPQSNAWNMYWLYAVERVGMIAGLRYFGRHDWYREGAEHLVNLQRPGGSWTNDLSDTAFAVLFLAKGRKPVLLNKLKWSKGNAWNPDRHDCENLTAYLGDSLREPVSWQVVSLDAPLADWLQAPILYFNGHVFPDFIEKDRVKLRDYVEAGGTLFVEACCSKAVFRKGFEKFIADVFPGHELRKLEAEHPVWTSLHRLKPGRWPLYGLDVGCRTSVIFSPRDLSCLWEQTDVPRLSESAFKVGANIAAYATGFEPLRDKLAEVVVPQKREQAGEAPPAPGALQIVQISHSGDWKPDPDAIQHLSEYLRTTANVDIVSRPIFLRADDPRLFDHPVAYMSGHFAFALGEKEREALAAYLKRGGFLFAEACCGREAFARSFQQLMRQVVPDGKLTPLPADHPIFAGAVGEKIDKVQYRPAVTHESPKLTTPVLLGLEVDHRTAVVFSPYGLGCGLAGHSCHACRGLMPNDSRRVAGNVVLYALTY